MSVVGAGPGGSSPNRTRFAMLKVEDGCVNFCTYCIIPYARGPVRSLPMDKAAEQVRALRSQGYRELVATGIEISSYGHDLKDGTTLIDLLELIAREGGEMRIRLGSLEPRTVTREFCERAKKLPTLCPHFHLSMQSGCDATLKRMNRRYDTVRYYESVELLREYFDDPAVTTDLITGFPEETEEEFGETLASSTARLRRHAHLPLFRPPRHEGRGDGAGGHERARGARGARRRRRGADAPRLSRPLRGKDLSRAL
ncbi:MAG: radical SAM protein [Oscillospiraceae bacterium]